MITENQEADIKISLHKLKKSIQAQAKAVEKFIMSIDKTINMINDIKTKQ